MLIKRWKKKRKPARNEDAMEEKTIENLLTLEFITKKQNVVITGSAAAGKTRLSEALESLARKAGFKTSFFWVPDLLKTLGNRKDYAQYGKAMKHMEKAHFVILDEFGYIPMTKQQSEDLYNFMAEALQDKSVLINTISKLSEWEKMIPDTVLAAAFVSRCTHNCIYVHLTGREKRNLKRLNRKTEKSADEQR